VTVDPIVAFEYLVAVHSGYFLRRQFDYFINRQKGAIAQSFLEKARVAGHIEIIDYGEARHVYHLFSKPIYRLIGNAESQNRRRKGDGLIRARLIALDYVLENDEDHYLESDNDKLLFFSNVRRIPQESFADHNGKLYPPLSSSPIAIVDRARPATCLVRFLFADEALITAEKFYRFLSVAESLLRALGSFELVYASNSAHNFSDAEAVFRRRFDLSTPARQNTLCADWRMASHPRDDERDFLPLHAQFTTVLLHWNYPRIRRKESRSLGMVRASGLPEREKVVTNNTDTKSRGSYVG
jgi:hypothetical protein